MTRRDTPRIPLSIHKAAWEAAEHRIRDDYIAAVAEAQRQFDIDTAPALATYRGAERAAWMVYMQAGKANWRAYMSAAEDPRRVTGEAGAPDPAGDNIRGLAQAGGSQPSFTPTHDPEGDAS